MANTNNQTKNNAWEGLGGPVSIDPYHFDGIDPTLDSCCQREVESNRKYNALSSSLKRHDVTLLAERRRRHLLHNLEFGSGCRCSYDPNADGGAYPSLVKLREESTDAASEKENDEPDEDTDKLRKDSDSNDSDDEFDYLLDDDLPIDSDLEERRRAELEFIMLSQEMALHHGYGAHRQMHPNRALKAAGLGVARDPAPAVVLHLYEDSRVSATLDLYLEQLALECKGTKFIRSGGRSTLLMEAALAAKTLPGLKPDVDLPVLIAIRHGDVVATSVRLQGLVDDDGIVPHAVRAWLDHANVLLRTPPAFDMLCRIRPEEDALLDNMRAGKQEMAPRYDCGIPTCYKPFHHEHVGISTNTQDGFLVPEEKIVGSSEAAPSHDGLG